MPVVEPANIRFLDTRSRREAASSGCQAKQPEIRDKHVVMLVLAVHERHESLRVRRPGHLDTLERVVEIGRNHMNGRVRKREPADTLITRGISSDEGELAAVG